MMTSLKRKAAAGLLAVSMVVSGMAGPAGAQETHIGRVHGHSSEQWEIWGTAGDTISVAAVGVGDARLGLFVYDDEGNLIAVGKDTTNICLAQFIVTRSSYFTLSVR